MINELLQAAPAVVFGIMPGILLCYTFYLKHKQKKQQSQKPTQ